VLSSAGALAVTAALVWQSAYAGFTDTTTNLPASITTGTVAVSNNVEGYGSLTLPEMRPGVSATQCVIVTSTGSKPAQIRLYGQNRSTTAVTNYLNFEWSSGSGGGVNGDCAGFVASGTPLSVSMAKFPTDYAAGVLLWDTAGGTATESRTYRLTYTMSSSAPTNTKGTSAGITFVWEAQNR
jgi:hypothetical protein